VPKRPKPFRATRRPQPVDAGGRPSPTFSPLRLGARLRAAEAVALRLVGVSTLFFRGL